MTTNKKNGAWFDYLAQSLVCSKQFLVRAGQFGTPEFHQLMDMRSKQPTFTVVEYKAERKTEKKTYGKLTYETMAKFIANYETDAGQRKAMLAEFDTVQKISKTQKAAYIFVKKWFLGKYKEVFDAWQEEQDAKVRAEQNDYLLYTE